MIAIAPLEWVLIVALAVLLIATGGLISSMLNRRYLARIMKHTDNNAAQVKIALAHKEAKDEAAIENVRETLLQEHAVIKEALNTQTDRTAEKLQAIHSLTDGNLSQVNRRLDDALEQVTRMQQVILDLHKSINPPPTEVTIVNTANEPVPVAPVSDTKGVK